MAHTALISSERSEAAVDGFRIHIFLLTFVFLLSLPLINPLVHGDGVGYYAYLRAPLIQHNLRFEDDWRHANLGFTEMRLSPDNEPHPDQYTSTGHISNLFTIGPAILWTPFFLLAHVTVLTANSFGAHIPADGFSLPYRVLVAFGTAFYGFCGLLLSYLLARKYLDPSWALLATLGVWAGSSLPVYMYFNPFWSHAHSAFSVALFLWYWDRTRSESEPGQWIVLGLISGLLVDVYFVNGVLLIDPVSRIDPGLLEGSPVEKSSHRSLASFGPECGVSRGLCAGDPADTADAQSHLRRPVSVWRYTVLPWNWHAPFWRAVLFSSDHGMLSWTPLLGFALLGLFLPFRAGKRIRAYLVACRSGLLLRHFQLSLLGWPGILRKSLFHFANSRICFWTDASAGASWRPFRAPSRFAYAAQGLVIALFAAWNLAFIFQWGTHMVPARGEISWNAMVHNQFVEVPLRMTHSLETYFLHRKDMMQHIEQEDIEQQKSKSGRGRLSEFDGCVTQTQVAVAAGPREYSRRAH